MRILSVSAQKPHSTGSGVYLAETVRAFADMGHSQAVLAGVYESDAVCFPAGVEFHPVYFNTPALPFPIAGMSDEMPYESTVYRQMSEQMLGQFDAAFTGALLAAVDSFRPDVIICHHLYLLAALTRRLFPSLAVWGVCHGTDLRQMHTNPLRRAYIRGGIAALDKVCCLHEAQRQAAIACYGLLPALVKTVGNGFNQQVFYNRNERRPHVEARLVYAGKISEKKGVYSLIAALDELGWPRDGFTLRLAGGWNGEAQHRQAQSLIDASGWDISLLGPLNQAQLAAEFNLGDIFVLPSFYDGLPLVLAESLACGMRAVCTDLPGIRPFMDANVPGHGIRFVQPPEMCDTDTPLSGCLPAFRRRLAAAIQAAAVTTADTAPDLSALSWPSVCGRILA